jgi:hypothetical protein
MTLGEGLAEFRKINGLSDPRLMLDHYFYSYRFENDFNGYRNYDDIEIWCDINLGENNWHREFNKFWFTSKSELVMFKLAWSGNQPKF